MESGAGMIQCTASDSTLIALLSARNRALKKRKEDEQDWEFFIKQMPKKAINRWLCKIIKRTLLQHYCCFYIVIVYNKIIKHVIAPLNMNIVFDTHHLRLVCTVYGCIWKTCFNGSYIQVWMLLEIILSYKNAHSEWANGGKATAMTTNSVRCPIWLPTLQNRSGQYSTYSYRKMSQNIAKCRKKSLQIISRNLYTDDTFTIMYDTIVYVGLIRVIIFISVAFIGRTSSSAGCN